MKKTLTTCMLALAFSPMMAMDSFSFGNEVSEQQSLFVLKTERYQLPSLEGNSDYQRILDSLNPANQMLGQNVGTLNSTGNGNGGDVLLCEPNSLLGATVHLLDLYEANYVKNMPIDLGAATLSLDAKMELLFSRMESKSKGWADRMRAYYQTFFQEAAAVEQANLVNVDDSDHLAIPTGCEIVQIAIQKETPLDSSDPRYVINETLWNLLTPDHQAALILHELIYRELVRTENSVLTRHLVGLLVSNRIESMSNEEYYKMFAQQGITRFITIDDVDIEITHNTVGLFQNPGVDYVDVAAQKEGLITIAGQNYNSGLRYDFVTGTHPIYREGDVYVDRAILNRDYEIEGIEVVLGPHVIDVQLAYGQTLHISQRVSIDTEGTIVAAYFAEANPFIYRTNGIEFAVTKLTLDGRSIKNLVGFKTNFGGRSINTPQLKLENVQDITLYSPWGTIQTISGSCSGRDGDTTVVHFQGSDVVFTPNTSSACNNLTVEFAEDGTVTSYQKS